VGRPKIEEEPVIINIKLTLYPSLDQDLIDWFDNLPPRGRASAVMSALRSGSIVLGGEANGTGEDEMAEDLGAFLM
jgi:hypothetical protein